MFRRIEAFSKQYVKKYNLNHGDVTNHIAEMFSETLFPKGTVLDNPDNEEITSEVKQLLDKIPALGHAYGGMLWGVELHSLLTSGHLFTHRSAEDRQAYLERFSNSRLVGRYLKAISAPMKYSYLTNEKLFAQLNLKNGVKVPTELEKHHWQQQIIDVDDYDLEENLEVDVLVIGTGAGGAAAAYELASNGLAVLILEEGKYLDRKDFTGKVPEMISKLYRSNGMTGAIGNTVIPIPIGRNVGGTTSINSGTCIRVPDTVLLQWQAEGLNELNKDNMEKYFSRVEEILQVQKADAKYVGEILRVIEQGGSEVVQDKGHLLTRNAVGCDGQGVCQFGCPTGAKQSTNVSFIPQALNCGAILMTGFCAEKITWDGDQVTGVSAIGIKKEDGQEKTISLNVKTKHLVVSMGSLLTPLFLQKNGVKNSQIGRNLSIHPAGAVTARFKDRIFDHPNTIPQGYGVAAKASKGLLFEGATPPLIAFGMMLPFIGKEFVSEIEHYRNRAFFGFMIKDKTRGRVRKGLIKGIPLVTYKMIDEDFDLFLEGISTLVEMYLASGAEEVHIAGCSKKPVIRNKKDLEDLLKMKLRPRDFLISAFHPLGTAKIGASPEHAVCDPDHQVFGKNGLYVMDGSSVPSSLGANPQVTIMAMAIRAADKLSKKINQEYQSN